MNIVQWQRQLLTNITKSTTHSFPSLIYPVFFSHTGSLVAGLGIGKIKQFSKLYCIKSNVMQWICQFLKWDFSFPIQSPLQDLELQWE